MTTHTSLRLALVVCVAAAGAVGCRGWESDKPPVHWNPNMDTQEKGKAYRKSDLFADGRMMRTPPKGTVARGYLNEDDHAVKGLVAEKPAQRFPASFAGTEEDMTRGRERYNVYCAPCHAKSGYGGGTVASRLQIPPANLHDARIKSMNVGQIYSAIYFGVNNGNMPSYAAQIPEHDRWAITYYVRALQKAQDKSVTVEGGEFKELAAAPAVASIARGQEVYAAKACIGCHSVDGSRLVGPSFKGLWMRNEKIDKGEVVADEAYIRESIAMPGAKIVEGYPPAMPPYQLDEIDLKSVLMFIESLK